MEVVHEVPKMVSGNPEVMQLFIQLFMNFYVLAQDYEDAISQWSQDEADYSGVDDSVGIHQGAHIAC